MSDTEFGNATGLPDRRTWTTARDIATLARFILREHPDRYALFGRRTLVWQERSFTNHNHLLGRVVGVDGIKTGFTNEAGYNLAASAARQGRRVIAVVLGAANRYARDKRAVVLLERGFAESRYKVALPNSASISKPAMPSQKRWPQLTKAAQAAAVFSLTLSK